MCLTPQAFRVGRAWIVVGLKPDGWWDRLDVDRTDAQFSGRPYRMVIGDVVVFPVRYYLLAVK